MVMRKKTLLFILFMINVCTSWGQLRPVKNMQTPEAASLGLYGQIPVSHYTGIPNISIPLYDVEVGDYKLPISASYHLSSVKPNTPSGIMGLGWNLMAGGQITRTVRGIMDEKVDKEGVGHGFYYHASKLKGMKNSDFKTYTEKKMRDEKGGSDWFELTPDEFSFNFCGYSGTFYYNENGGWTVVSDDDIKVEFTPDNKGFIRWKDLKKKFLNYEKWTGNFDKNCFFNQFTLITPDGVRYTFGGYDATEYSIPYYLRANADLTPTTWKLKNITLLNGQKIDFVYESYIACDIRYVPRYYGTYNKPTTVPNRYITNFSAYTGFLLFSTCLSEIHTSTEDIFFNNENQWHAGIKNLMYKDRFALYRKIPKKNYDISDDCFNIKSYDEAYAGFMQPSLLYFLIDIKANSEQDYNRITDIQNRIIGTLKSKSLSKIEVYSYNEELKSKIEFEYTDNLGSGTDQNTRLKLKTITFGNNNVDNNDRIVYRFNYDKTKMPYAGLARCFPLTDSWGYYNGGTENFSINPSFYIKSTIPSMAKAETLTEIIYPTGGKTRFVYEGNDYSYVQTRDNNGNVYLDEGDKKYVGLRISEIKTLDADDNLINKKKYHYSKAVDGKSSGILNRKPSLSLLYTVNKTWKLEVKSTEGYGTPVTNMSSPDVGYSWVIEEIQGKNGECMGYVRYRYSNYDNDIKDVAHTDDDYSYFTAGGRSEADPYASRSLERGKLISEEYFDASWHKVREKTYVYKALSSDHIVTPYQQFIRVKNEYNNDESYFFGWLHYTYIYHYNLMSVKDVIYEKTGKQDIAYEEIKEFKYNKNNLVNNELIITSENIPNEIYYKYPADVYDEGIKHEQWQIANWMMKKHILSPVLWKSINEAGTSIWYRYDYDKTENGVAYINKVSISHNSSGKYKVGYRVISADCFGNPVEIEENGLRSVLVWSYAGQKMIARIDNATKDEVEKYLNGEDITTYIPQHKDYLSISWEDIEKKCRNKMPNAHFTIYKYDEFLRLESITDPTGMTVYYKYDFLGRLREKYYYEKGINHLPVKRIMEQYDYRY